ncbi:hypothetical protein CHLNCDRAFT_138596 [Chlorella variabilis]|uniref:Uncharacterized protein n=1 Tax=Chlorella variabilis TaxID=554065 RepID=E1ZNC8_CHLVA|nr:hypothetical protein CHLNCDRAFT_138596 [Chlorella variabilis]EFN52660.1 hypothetical protein CHLNCDRAFT_138596 [Chlorella variabilis]|eukprot:XP_005844762.1 hypothetical protein CHLNCDRAFT_138596 [Chlorella variabilis]
MAMADISPFASAFEAFAGGEEPPNGVRVEGFDESHSSGGSIELRPVCSLTERQSSVGALSQLLLARRQLEREQAALRPGLGLTIQTARSGLRLGPSSRLRRGAGAPRIQEDAEFGDSGGGAAADPHLGGTAPSCAPHAAQPMARACSGNIDMPARLSKAQTAPEGLPDSLVLAALTAGLGRSHGASRFSPTAVAGTLPSQQPLHPPPAPAQAPPQPGAGRSGSGGAGGSARPPMPVTPIFAAAARSGQHSCQPRRQPPPQQQAQQQPQSASAGAAAPPQRQGSSYRDLFDAQAETAMAQAQVAGLQEALRRKDEELERLKQELLAVTAERSMLREAAGPAVRANLSAGVLAAAPAGPPSAAASQAAARGPRGAGGLAAAALRCQAAAPRAAPAAVAAAAAAAAAGAAPAPPAPAAPEEEALVSAFANAQAFSFE